jgi:hypothetical protein
MITSVATFQARAYSSGEVAGGTCRGQWIVRGLGTLDEADRDVGECLAATLHAPRATVNPKDDARWRL